MPFPVLAAIAAAGTIKSLIDKSKASGALNKLHNLPVPKFAETPEMASSRMRADKLAEGGYTPAEKALFRKNVAEDINTQSRKALDMGGGQLAKVIAGQGKINTIGAESRFAANDAALHRQNIQYSDKFSQILQRISDMNIEKQLQQRLMAEQSLGAAVRDQDTNMMNFAMLGASQFGGGSGGGTGGTGRTMGDGTTGANGWQKAAMNRMPNPSLDDYDPANAISSGLDPNATDPLSFYHRLGKISRGLQY